MTINVSQTLESVKQVIGNVAGKTTDTLHGASSVMTQTAERSKLALDGTFQKAEQLGGSITNGMQDAMVTSLQQWLAQHPIFAWVVAQPLWAIALLCLSLFLGWSLLGALVRVTQNVWLLILQAPWKLVQWLFGGIWQWFNRPDANPVPRFEPPAPLHPRLAEILDRLDTLRQEQDALMQEMQAILLSKTQG